MRKKKEKKKMYGRSNQQTVMNMYKGAFLK